MAHEAQKPSQGPNRGQLSAMRAYNLLRTKHFHGVSSGNQHPYLLKSRYGKVRKVMERKGANSSHPITYCVLNVLRHYYLIQAQ